HRQALNGDVMDDLVIAALEAGGIDRAERLVALAGKTRSKSHRMLLGDADIEGAIRERLGEDVDAGARRHRRGDADDLVILFGFLDEALAEYVLIGWRVRLGFRLSAGGDIELDHGVVFVGGGFRRTVALALPGEHMDVDRSGFHVAVILYSRQQSV